MENYQTLGPMLANARRNKGLSLRAVEATTGISNAYLSQLEGGRIKQPSPVMLHKLSDLYSLPYADVLRAAGYPVPGGSSAEDAQAGIAARLGPTTTEEEEALADYLRYLRSRNQRGGSK